MEKIIEDQKEFEREHQFIQVSIAPFYFKNMTFYTRYIFKLSTDACMELQEFFSPINRRKRLKQVTEASFLVTPLGNFPLVAMF